MQAQVVNQSKPSFAYGFKYKNKSYKEVLSFVRPGEDDDESMLNIIDALNMNGFMVIADTEMFRHMESFVRNPNEYLSD